MDLAEFASHYSEPGEVRDLIDSGPASQRLYDRIGNESLTRPLLATNFWRAWLASDVAMTQMTSLGTPTGVLARSRLVVASAQEDYSFSLIILDPLLPPTTPPKTSRANVQGVAESIARSGVWAFREEVPPVIGADATQLAVEVGRSDQTLSVIVAPEPEFERLSVPLTGLLVDNQLGQNSSVGVLVEDRRQLGRLGVTAALHGVDPATAVSIGGYAGTVLRTDTVTDSAFIEASALALPPFAQTNGVMAGFTPRGKQNAVFSGFTSGSSSTVVTGWDPQVPTPSSRRQACVYTGRDAQPGDSGAALVTDDGWIVGFAFERTKPGEVPAACSWVWADSVLNRLDVKLR